MKNNTTAQESVSLSVVAFINFSSSSELTITTFCCKDSLLCELFLPLQNHFGKPEFVLVEFTVSLLNSLFVEFSTTEALETAVPFRSKLSVSFSVALALDTSKTVSLAFSVALFSSTASEISVVNKMIYKTHLRYQNLEQ